MVATPADVVSAIEGIFAKLAAAGLIPGAPPRTVADVTFALREGALRATALLEHADPSPRLRDWFSSVIALSDALASVLETATPELVAALDDELGRRAAH